jgi:hypothetical protein
MSYDLKIGINYTPENISFESTLIKTQYSTQLILVLLNQYFKKMLKFHYILVLFQAS